MNRILAIAAAGLQLGVLAFMAGQREWVVRQGRMVYLRTAPIDPRDVMRGDYVRLNYEISHVPSALWQGGLSRTLPLAVSNRRLQDKRVYAALNIGRDDLGELVSLSDAPPASGPYLRGRLQSWGAAQAEVHYGIEAYFMEQGTAGQLEQARFRDGIQIPLEMQVAFSPGGLAVLRQHRWAPLGIGLELKSVETPGTNAWRTRQTIAATVRLLNASSNDLAVVDLPGGASFSLVPDSLWGENPWRWVPVPAGPPSRPEPGHVLVLKPGQAHAIRLDFTDPYWSITNTTAVGDRQKTTRTLASVEPAMPARFRLEYRPPAPEICRGLPGGELIWHGRLPSRAFSTAGQVD